MMRIAKIATLAIMMATVTSCGHFGHKSSGKHCTGDKAASCKMKDKSKCKDKKQCDRKGNKKECCKKKK